MDKHDHNSLYAYWCTWDTQNCMAEKKEKNLEKSAFIGDQGAKLARSILNEESVFGADGWAYLFGGVKNDLYLMLDDGWDVPYGVHPDSRRDGFGSLVLNEERFPFAQGAPANRLKLLNDRIKKCGWKGVGIWIAAQQCGEKFGEPFMEEEKDYWRDRILWSKYAGISYWKVDWGTHASDNEFRRFLSETAKVLYPELVVEHAICQPPLNGGENPVEGLEGRFSGDKTRSILSEECVKFSEVFRTYDVLPPLSVATTIDRASHLLRYAKGYLNVEDEVYLAAALGCQMGVMRSKYGAGIRDCGDKLQEVYAAIAWQKIMPPFMGGQTFVSDEILFDDYTFSEDETWYQPAIGKKIIQGAPCVLSRNTPLPDVTAGENCSKPFVVSSCYNGTYAVAIFPRMIAGKRGYVGGKVICSLAEMPERIAVFGIADKIEFIFHSGKINSVTANSLFRDKPMDISIKPSQDGSGFLLSGEEILKIGSADDKSDPAVVLKIKYAAKSLR